MPETKLRVEARVLPFVAFAKTSAFDAVLSRLLLGLIPSQIT
jgi:hypothetical protein